MNRSWPGIKASSLIPIAYGFPNPNSLPWARKPFGPEIFSFGRDHGYYGRIFSQTVVAKPTVTVHGDREVVGFCFTPQDGNSLASSIAAALWIIDPDFDRKERLSVLDRFFFREI